MAWTVKPSATTSIKQRAEPYLTDEMKAGFTAEILPRYETRRAALMPILNDLQHRYRCIAHQAMVEVAQFLAISPADVLDTVSFYEEYTTEPTGKCIVAVCQSIACEICGQVALLDHLRDRLGIEPHIPNTLPGRSGSAVASWELPGLISRTITSSWKNCVPCC